ncbi:MAG: ATP-binding cassette domain-containing protein, partial [Ilumatobacteraceae bacterium]
MSTLEIKGLRAEVAGKEILQGIDLVVKSGEVHAIMGPNGAGKSTLSAVIMGKPGYKVLAGSVTLDGVDMLALPTWERAIAGMHLVMQYPTEVPGVHADQVMAEALTARHRGTEGMAARITQEALRINMDPELVTRALNVDLSGGEKK